MPALKTSDPKAGRHYRKYLVELTESVSVALKLLDDQMKQPSTVERGRAIARILNNVEMARDAASHFGLGKRLGRFK